MVATSALLDPNFTDTVVLLLDADDEGTLGVVLNRPTEVPVADVLHGWESLVADPPVLFQGGPVGVDGALAVGLAGDPADTPDGFRAVIGRLGLVDLDGDAGAVGRQLAALRIYAGYAGWGPGQLQREIDEGSWYVVPAEATDVFSPGDADLWRLVMKRQPGELAWHSTRPADATLN